MAAVAAADWTSPPKMIQTRQFLTDRSCGECMTYLTSRTVKRPGGDTI